jgi:2'-5' RNA ligase
LFVAVVPPAPVLDRLDALDRPAVDGVRWTTRDQWHVTLHFLGQAEEAPAAAALAGVAAEATAVVLGPWVELLGRHVVVVPAAGLSGLAAVVTAAFAGIGRPPEDRPFRGHLTLARVRRGSRFRPARQPFDERFVAEELVLLRSRTLADGARYEPVASRALGPAVRDDGSAGAPAPNE